MERMQDNMKKQTKRATIEEVFAQFSSGMEAGDISPTEGLLSDNVRLSFSNIGDLEGKQEVIKGLSNPIFSKSIVKHFISNNYTATKGNIGKQSAYLTGFVVDTLEEDNQEAWFGGYFTNSYEFTDEGWKIVELRFELDWLIGSNLGIKHWKEPRRTIGWSPNMTLPKIISELDSPWRVFPKSDELGSDEEQILDAYTQYAWATDHDIGLMKDLFTEELEANLVPIGKIDNKRELMTAISTFRSGRVSSHHAIGDYEIEVNGDVANMKIFRRTPVHITEDTINRNFFSATYDCSLRKIDGKWKFEKFFYTEGNVFERVKV
jgi:hypothetical protein